MIRKFSFIYLPALAGVLLVFLSTALLGQAQTHDSVAYLHAAKTLLQGEGIRYFGYDSPFIQWPPLYVFLLALGQLLGMEMAAFSTLLNAILLGAYNLLLLLLIERFVKQKAVQAFAAILVVFSQPVLWVSQFLWSEILYLVLMLLALFAYLRYRKNPSLINAILLALPTALACLSRYIGVTLILTFGLFMLLERKRFLVNLRNAFVFGILSALPTVIWLVRNYLVSHTLVGLRLPSGIPLSVNIQRISDTLRSWAQPVLAPYETYLTRLVEKYVGFLPTTDAVWFFSKVWQVSGWVFITVACVSFAALVVHLLIAILKRSTRSRLSQHAHPSQQVTSKHAVPALDGACNGACNSAYNSACPESLHTAVLLVFHGVFYAGYMAVSASKVSFDPLGTRYLIPLYLCLSVLVILGVAQLYSLLAVGEHIGSNLLRLCLSLLLAASLLSPVMHTALSVTTARANGAGGFQTQQWLSDPLLAAARELPPDAPVFANNAAALYGYINVQNVPKTDTSMPMYGFSVFAAQVEQAGHAYLVWFGTSSSALVYDPARLAEHYRMTTLTETSSGRIYRMELKEPLK